MWTSDERGAGTDANVFMTLYGKKGKTDVIQIGNATDNFEQGQLDKFKVQLCQLQTSNCDDAPIKKELHSPTTVLTYGIYVKRITSGMKQKLLHTRESNSPFPYYATRV